MGQLSDYLAMPPWLRSNPTRFRRRRPPSSMCFNDNAAGRAPADGMTRMDAAYLQALYAVGPRQPGELQNDQIANRVVKRLVTR